MLELDTPIESASFIAPKIIAPLKRLGIRTIKDLLYHFPSRYDDFRERKDIGSVAPDETVTIEGIVKKIGARRTATKRVAIVEAVIEDDTGAIKAIWFNQPFVARNMKEGQYVSCSGKIQLTQYGIVISNPVYERVRPIAKGRTEAIHTGGLIPVYPETEGITSRWIRFIIQATFERIASIADPLPETVRKRRRFPEYLTALRAVHFPDALEDASGAEERFIFEELLILQLHALRERSRLKKHAAPSIAFNLETIKRFVASLPFELTNAQRRSIWEIGRDLAAVSPMNRLLEGDVGSGKTVVAAASCLLAAESGYASVLMAPTEILANQHFQTFTRVLAPFGHPIGLLTGSLKDHAEKTIVVGTHALIQEHVRFERLGLVIIDEQHRFGVEQRASLLKKGGASDTETLKIPHFLSMTATPIPRTLALTVYGNLDISLLDETPKSRRPIITEIYAPKEQERAHALIRAEIAKGRQAFVICPKIDIEDPTKRKGQQVLVTAEAKAVKMEYERLQSEIFPNFRIAMLHGKMRPKEKDATMRAFKEREYDILVATSVIEVGVDVPNASVMIIEGAERFGLAQLHQFRGRIGRGEHQSYCLLFPSDDGIVTRRLRAVAEARTGFELAEKDFEIRGPGDLLGTRQSGVPDLALRGMQRPALVHAVREEAIALVKTSPDLTAYPALLNALRQREAIIHEE